MSFVWKKAGSLFTVLVLLIAVAQPVFAAPNGLFTEDDKVVFADTSHGRHLYLDSNHQIALNQYTSGMPVNGTLVTTWHVDTTDSTQSWEFWGPQSLGIGASKVVIVPRTNPDIGLNIVRASTGTSLTANLYPLVGNYYNDTALDGTRVGRIPGEGLFDGWTFYQLSAPPRTTNGVTYPRLYLHMTNSPTPVSDGYNTSKYMKFETSPSTIYYPDADDDYINQYT